MTDSATAFISISNLHKTYGFKKFQALNDVNLQINKGEIFGLIGPNGVGKTTLMGCLLGLLKPTAGTILIDGKSVYDLSVKAITGFVPERPHFDAWMIVENFLHYHHMLAKQPESSAKEDVAQALADVGLTQEVGKRSIRKLSRGMLQRLGLAQLLIGKPQLCFLDEPTSGMDPLGMALVHDLLLRWRQEGKTVIINSHHLDQVEQVCDRVAFIQSGKIASLEELRPTMQSKQPFVVYWGNPNPTNDAIMRIAQEAAIECEYTAQDCGRFLLTSRAESTKLLKALIAAEVQIEEAVYERKDLVELFRNEAAKETVETNKVIENSEDAK